VSIGNILLCGGVPKLADLEYAKKIGDMKSHEMRTASEFSITSSGKIDRVQQGTMHFMSIEVAAQAFLFCPPPERISIAEMVQQAEMTQNLTAQVPFSQNHLHDLESLWWVAVWMVFYHYFSKAASSDDHGPFTLEDVDKDIKLARTLFPSVLKSTDRQNGFQTLFPTKCVGLPSNKKVISNFLNHLRIILLEQYKIVESELSQSIKPNSSTDEIYDNFKTLFSASMTSSRDLVLEFIPAIYTKLKNENSNPNSKRPRSESTNDTGVAQKTPRRK
jgi:hypothetical protein